MPAKKQTKQLAIHHRTSRQTATKAISPAQSSSVSATSALSTPPRDIKPCKIMRLVLGDQLNGAHSWFMRTDPNVLYVLIESRMEATYTCHHIQKILAFFAAMRVFATELHAKGHRVHYVSLDEPTQHERISDVLVDLIASRKAEFFEYLLPDEYRLDQELRDFCKALTLPSSVSDTEHFLTTRDAVRNLFAGKKQFLMETFYRSMRKQLNILMEGATPVGGQWNFDHDNRAKIDNVNDVPAPLTFPKDVSSLAELIKNQHIQTLGTIPHNELTWPVTRAESLALLEHFCTYRLPLFGTYQDAMHTEHDILYHSKLSFSLNVKLISPLEVVQRVVQEWQDRPDEIELHQVEGFVRQIIGWREYMRGLYWHLMPDFHEMNYFEHNRPLPAFYWTGETKMNCVHHAVQQSLDTAYAHHIQRLMITGNFALLAGIDPTEVDAWYLGIYVDAIEWVQLPNTRGMSQYADGGIVASKPYISGGNYIHKMSNYCDSCHYRQKLRHGERSCPFNSLYWYFLERHRAKLSQNQRIAMPLRTLEKFDPTERSKIRTQAEYYLQHIESL